MLRRLSQIDTLIVHCADVRNGRKTTVEEIDGWHRARGFERGTNERALCNPDLTSIGYHFVIYVDGQVVSGRGLAEVGAQAQGHNTNSLGICLVGRDAYARAQWDALKAHIATLQARLDREMKIIGHHDVQPAKTCPGFVVADWLAAGMVPDEKHVFTGGAPTTNA